MDLLHESQPIETTSLDRAELCRARACLIESTVAENLAAVFKALSDPTRLRIISVLAERELCVNDLAAALEMGQSAVSHQLGDMREKHLVRSRRDGRRIFYRLDDDHIRDLFGQGLAHIRHQ